MKNYVYILFLTIFLTGCATGNKFGEETCKDIHGQFTKAVKCLELKFVSLNPKKNEEYKETYDLILKALANQVYENRIDRNYETSKSDGNHKVAQTYGGQFLWDAIGLEDRPILMMDGFAGQQVVIDFENNRIITAHSTDRHYDYYSLVYSVLQD